MSQKPNPAEESFLQRWSRRKREQSEATSPTVVVTPIPEVTNTPPPVAFEPAETDKPAVTETETELPSLDSLNEQTDMRGFFAENVSPQLRQQALRALFKQPRFNACDGLDVYAEDYTRFEPLGDIITHEMRRAFAAETKKAEEEALASAEQETETEQETVEELADNRAELDAENTTEPDCPKPT